MISAFVLSCAFLISYLIYYYRAGHVRVSRAGMDLPSLFRVADFAYASGNCARAVNSDYATPQIDRALRDKHRATAGWTWPLWFYLSVTGVIVYRMVYQT